ncbi:MAG: hypothetical protein FWG87_11280 [Defluviitaleaceae bacterium]|nr:hypothetical protein [Defluviitaleaceae bacterium]
MPLFTDFGLVGISSRALIDSYSLNSYSIQKTSVVANHFHSFFCCGNMELKDDGTQI